MMSALHGALQYCGEPSFISDDVLSMYASNICHILLPLASRMVATSSSLGPDRPMHAAADAELWRHLGCMWGVGCCPVSSQQHSGDQLAMTHMGCMHGAGPSIQLSEAAPLGSCPQKLGPPLSLLPAMRSSALGMVTAIQLHGGRLSAEFLLADLHLEKVEGISVAQAVDGLASVVVTLCGATPPGGASLGGRRLPAAGGAGRLLDSCHWGDEGEMVSACSSLVPSGSIEHDCRSLPESDTSTLEFQPSDYDGNAVGGDGGADSSAYIALACLKDMDRMPSGSEGASWGERPGGSGTQMQQHQQSAGCQQQQAGDRHTLAEATILLMLEPMCRAAVSDLEAAAAPAAAADLAVQKAKGRTALGLPQTYEDLKTAIAESCSKTKAWGAHVAMVSGKTPLMTIAAVSLQAASGTFAGAGSQQWPGLPLLSVQQRGAAGPHLAVLYGLSHAGVPELLAGVGAACRSLLDRLVQLARLHVELTNSAETAVAEVKRGGGAAGAGKSDEAKLLSNHRYMERVEAAAAAVASVNLTWHLSRLYPSTLAGFEAITYVGVAAAIASGQQAARCIEDQQGRQPPAMSANSGSKGAPPIGASVVAEACVEAVSSSLRLVESCAWVAQLLDSSLVSSLLLAPEPALVLQPCLLRQELQSAVPRQGRGEEEAQSRDEWLFGGQLMGMLVGRLLSHLTLVAEEVHELVEACRPGLSGGSSRSGQLPLGGVKEADPADPATDLTSHPADLAADLTDLADPMDLAVDVALSELGDAASSAELTAVALAKMLNRSSLLDAVLEEGLGPSERLKGVDNGAYMSQRFHDRGLLLQDTTYCKRVSNKGPFGGGVLSVSGLTPGFRSMGEAHADGISHTEPHPLYCGLRMTLALCVVSLPHFSIHPSIPGRPAYER